MGLENRDYLRDEERRYSGGGGPGGFQMASYDAPMCKKIIIVTVIVYVAQLLIRRDWTQDELQKISVQRIFILQHEINQTGDPDGKLSRALGRIQQGQPSPEDLGIKKRESVIEDWLRLDFEKLKSGQVWRLATYAVCHDQSSLFHIVMNMLLLWLIGRMVEDRLKSREFLAFYIIAAMVAGLMYLVIGAISGNVSRVIGASGAVLGVLMTFTMWDPRLVLRIFGIVPLEIRWITGAVIVLDLYPALQAIGGENVDGNVAHAAHLGGVLFGWLYVKYRLQLTTAVSDLAFRRRVRKSGLRVVQEDQDDDDDLQIDIDSILKKISVSGESSLTRAERKRLEKASREIRNRRK